MNSTSSAAWISSGPNSNRYSTCLVHSLKQMAELAKNIVERSIAVPGVQPKEDTEELALALEGKNKKLKWEHFERLGKKLELNDRQITGVVNRFRKNKPIAMVWIDNSFLSGEYKEKYVSLLEERYSVLFQ